MGFKNWNNSSFKDVFGLENIVFKSDDTKANNEVFDPVNVDIIVNELIKHNFHNQEPTTVFSDVIIWGRLEEPGSLKIEVSPLGSLKIIVHKAATNLVGEHLWICKKIVPLKEKNININEIATANFVIELLTETDKQSLDYASPEYDKFKLLVYKIDQSIRSKAPDVFIYDNLKFIDEHHSITSFSCRGQGVELPTRERLVQFSNEIYYDRQAGTIRCFGYEISTPIKGHHWHFATPEWDEIFMPSQPVQEIANALGNAISVY